MFWWNGRPANSALRDFVLEPVLALMTHHIINVKCDDPRNAAHALVALFDRVRSMVRGVIDGGRSPGSYLINFGLDVVDGDNVESWLSKPRDFDAASDSEPDA